MKFDGAVIKVMRVRFAIVVVKPHVIDSKPISQKARLEANRFFPAMPIILLSRDLKGKPTYQGRLDIIRFLAKVHPSRIPWRTYTVDQYYPKNKNSWDSLKNANW